MYSIPYEAETIFVQNISLAVKNAKLLTVEEKRKLALSFLEVIL